MATKAVLCALLHGTLEEYGEAWDDRLRLVPNSTAPMDDPGSRIKTRGSGLPLRTFS